MEEIIKRIMGKDIEGLFEVLKDIGRGPISSELPQDRKSKDIIKIEQQLQDPHCPLEIILEYAKILFALKCDDEACLKAYGRVFLFEPKNTQAYHHISKILHSRGMDDLASALSHRGLELKVPGNENPNLHQRFHFNLADAGFILLDKGISLPDEGYPLNRIDFVFSKERGFYIPDFEFNCPNKDYEEVGMKKGKQRTLCHIHYALGKYPHNKSNCPYLSLIGENTNK